MGRNDRQFERGRSGVGIGRKERRRGEKRGKEEGGSRKRKCRWVKGKELHRRKDLRGERRAKGEERKDEKGRRERERDRPKEKKE